VGGRRRPTAGRRFSVPRATCSPTGATHRARSSKSLITSAAAEVADPLERIAAGFDAAVEDCLAQPELLRLMLDLLVVGATNDAVRQRARELLDNLINTIADEVDRVSATLPAQPVFDRSEFDLPAAIAGAFDGIFLHSAVREADPMPAFHALKTMLLSFAANAVNA
jgi:AcrR family transcriptional regulator